MIYKIDNLYINYLKKMDKEPDHLDAQSFLSSSKLKSVLYKTYYSQGDQFSVPCDEMN